MFVQIFFYPLIGSASPDPALLAYIQSNGGRNNIVTVTQKALASLRRTLMCDSARTAVTVRVMRRCRSPMVSWLARFRCGSVSRAAGCGHSCHSATFQTSTSSTTALATRSVLLTLPSVDPSQLEPADHTLA